MRISDWSSDVCSSDLLGRADEIPGRGALEHGDVRRPLAVALFGHRRHDGDRVRARSDHDDLLARIIEILRPELRVEDLPPEILASGEMGVIGLVIIIIARTEAEPARGCRRGRGDRKSTRLE